MSLNVSKSAQRFSPYFSLLQSSMIQVHSCKEQGIIPAPGDVVTAKVRWQQQAPIFNNN